MGMDCDSTEHAGLTSFQIPRSGLDELLSAWTGDGPLIDALSTDETGWRAADIRRRAQRILFGRIAVDMEELPTSMAEWLAVLPAASEAERLVSRSPGSGVRWGESARRFGWPPRSYVVRPRYRVHDQTALTTLAWLAQRLKAALPNVQGDAPVLSATVAPAIHLLGRVAEELLGDTEPLRPDRDDLGSLAGSGHPWTAVSRISALVLRAEIDPAFVAYDLLLPEPGAADRLFHLSTFGEVLRILRMHHFRVKWAAPFGGSAGGPKVTAQSPAGDAWELWFEGAGLRKRHDLPPSAYSAAVAHIEKAGGSIGADVVLYRPAQTTRALLLECKWSDKPAYVARSGFHQAASYALDARDGFAEDAWAFVVGPCELVPAPSVSVDWRPRWSITVGSASVESLHNVVNAFLADDPSVL